jgi:photosystem II stability/assembly factor-like uncharacterized protein
MPGRLLVLAVCALLLAGCAREADEHRAVPTSGGKPTFLAQAFDATGTLLVGTPLGVYRSSDGGRTWHTTQRHVWGALAAGFTQASTIVSRGRLLQRGNLSYDHVDAPKRSPFHGGSVLALSWLPGGKLYALVRGTYWHLYVTLDSARSWYPRPALDLPRSARAIAVARAKGRPDVLYAATGRAGLWRSVDAGVSWSRLPVRANAQSVATTPARWQRVVAALPELSWSDDYGATWHRSGPRATIVASDPRNERIWYAVAPDGELLVSTDGGRSW